MYDTIINDRANKEEVQVFKTCTSFPFYLPYIK